MSAPDQPTKADIRRAVRELLGRATLARARGQREDAIRLVQEAIGLDDTDAEAHELKGDLLLEVDRGGDAIASFRRARELRPDRGLLEDKVARAALQMGKARRSVELSQALLEGRAKRSVPKRNPGYAALLSLIVPGLGQLYNGDLLKGLGMVTVYLFLALLAILSLLREIASSGLGLGGSIYGPSPQSMLSTLFSGSAAPVTVILAVLWVYSVADAALRASRTMTSDDTGLV